MKIEIYGTGCKKCTKLYELAEKIVKESGIDAEVVKVSDLMEIMNAGVMVTPGLSVDGRLMLSGRLPSEKELKSILGV